MSGKRANSQDTGPAKCGYTPADLNDVSDNAEISEREMAEARPFAEAFPALADSIRRGRGKQRAPTKQLISIRLDQEVIEAFKATGEGWQGRINAALRKAALK